MKQFLTTLTAILVAAALIYGFYSWKQTRDYRTVLESRALSQIAADMDDIAESNNAGNTFDHGIATRKLLSKLLAAAKSTLLQLEDANISNEVVTQQREHVVFLEEVSQGVTEKLERYLQETRPVD